MGRGIPEDSTENSRQHSGTKRSCNASNAKNRLPALQGKIFLLAWFLITVMHKACTCLMIIPHAPKYCGTVYVMYCEYCVGLKKYCMSIVKTTRHMLFKYSTKFFIYSVASTTLDWAMNLFTSLHITYKKQRTSLEKYCDVRC